MESDVFEKLSILQYM